MKSFLVALGFLTRIPVPSGVFRDSGAQARSLAWYPLVGTLVGVLLSIAARLMHAWPPLLVASVLLVLWIAITGALHLDGLADSADAWIGGMGDRERTLAIMKDPRCGPAGVVALIAVLLLKFAALASLPVSAWLLLWVAPMLARGLVVAGFLSTPYVRENGLGSRLGGGSRVPSMISLTLVVLLTLWLGWRTSLALIACIALFAWWRQACMRRLGGMTGDTLGALVEIAEAVVLLIFAVTL